MLPKFLVRRLRWGTAFALAGALITNRYDSARWWQFARRTARRETMIGSDEWKTEARVRTALTLDRTLRRTPTIKDVVIDGDTVLLFVHGSVWPDVVRHTRSLQRVKGISEVRCIEIADDPAEIAVGAPVND
jgi:hypothetical protein